MSDDQKHVSQNNSETPISKILEVSKQISSDRSTENLKKHLNSFFKEFSLTSFAERKNITKAVDNLKSHPLLTDTLMSMYDFFSDDMEYKKYQTMQILGGLQDSKCLDFFEKEIWKNELHSEKKTYPKENTKKKGCQLKYKHNLKIKAIHGLGYLQSQEAYQKLEKIMQHHKILSLQVAAIDTYMWNHKDSPKTANYLYHILPKPFHPYVQRPRFFRGMDQQNFISLVNSWKEKWGKGELGLPLNPKYKQYLQKKGEKHD